MEPVVRGLDPFAYVNQYYGLDLCQGRRVVSTYGGRRAGRVWKADSASAHIHIKFDDTGKVEGPYHPTSNLEYPPEGA